MNTRIILLSVCLLSFFMCAAQTNNGDLFGRIRVTVLEVDGKTPVPFATVYLSKTTIGGRTDAIAGGVDHLEFHG